MVFSTQYLLYSYVVSEPTNDSIFQLIHQPDQGSVCDFLSSYYVIFFFCRSIMFGEGAIVGKELSKLVSMMTKGCRLLVIKFEKTIMLDRTNYYAWRVQFTIGLCAN